MSPDIFAPDTINFIPMKVKFLTIPLIIVCSGCSGEVRHSEPDMHIETVRAYTIRDTSSSAEFPFIAKPLRTSVLSFRVSGPVDSFDVFTGNRYRRGELIAGIDTRDFRLQYEQADAAYRLASSDYERISALYEKDNLPASSYESARAAWISAETARDAALNAMQDTKLTAPFDGYVGEVFIERYQHVKATQPIVTLADISSLRIEIYVTQNIAMQADKLERLELEFDCLPGEKFYAESITCAKSTTKNNLSYLLTALVPNPDNILPAGLSGTVRISLPAVSAETVALPLKAVCHTYGYGDHVWIVDTSTETVTRRQVTAGDLLPGGMIAITDGLEPVETVAMSGQRFLQEGKTVKTAGMKTGKQDSH